MCYLHKAIGTELKGVHVAVLMEGNCSVTLHTSTAIWLGQVCHHPTLLVYTHEPPPREMTAQRLCSSIKVAIQTIYLIQNCNSWKQKCQLIHFSGLVSHTYVCSHYQKSSMPRIRQGNLEVTQGNQTSKPPVRSRTFTSHYYVKTSQLIL